MRSISFTILLFIALLAACRCQDTHVNNVQTVQHVPTIGPELQVSSQRKARNVLIAGDSEACAVGEVARDIANEQIPPDSVNVSCKPGSTIQYWAGGMHLKRALSTYPKTDTLLVFLGTNHYLSKEVPDPKLLLSIVSSMRLTCVWVGNVAVHGKTWPINGMLRKAVTPTCDYFDSEHVKLRDGVHPDAANAKQWLKQVWESIPRKE